MASDSCHLWFFARQKITYRVFTGTSLVTGYSTTRRWYIWTGMAGWMQWVSLVGRVYLSRSSPNSSFLTAMKSTSVIGTHIFSNPTTSPHLSSMQATPPITSQMIMCPTWSLRDITAYQKWDGRHSMEPSSLLLPTWILFLWICVIHFNKNHPLSSLLPLKKRSSFPLPHLITTPMPKHV